MESPRDPESVLFELDMIRDALSGVLDSLTQQEMAALILETRAYLDDLQDHDDAPAPVRG